MLVLTRRIGEEIIIRHKGETITVRVARFLHLNGNDPQVRIGITAPKDVNIVRAEIDDHRETRQ